MPAAPPYYTADMVRSFPEDGNRYETVHGELLVSPSPRFAHQLILRRLDYAIASHLHRAGIEGVFSVDADISWSDDTLVQPDLFVADPDEMHRAQSWADIRTLHLVVEVLSPSSIRADRFTKRRLYQEQRIPVYWIVDIDNRQVETWTPDSLFPVVERESIGWQHPMIVGECRVDLGVLFRAP